MGGLWKRFNYGRINHMDKSIICHQVRDRYVIIFAILKMNIIIIVVGDYYYKKKCSCNNYKKKCSCNNYYSYYYSGSFYYHYHNDNDPFLIYNNDPFLIYNYYCH